MATKSQLKAMQQRRAQAVSRGQAQSIRPEVARGLPQSIRPESIRPDVALPHALPAQPRTAAQERLHGQGVLRVLVRRASGLKGADRGGTSSDPYVVVKIGAQEQRTRTIMRSLNPVWEQTLEFRGSLTDLLAQSMSLSVKDHDEISRDDHLGNLVLPLRHQLEYADTKELSLDLPTQGTLQLQLQWHPLSQQPPPSRLPPPPPKRDVPAGRLEQRGTLRVHLHRASGIKAADLGTTLKTLASGTSDAYVSLRLLERSVRSKVRKKTLTLTTNLTPTPTPTPTPTATVTLTPTLAPTLTPTLTLTLTLTKVCKKTLEPQWNETLTFANLKMRDVVRAPLRLSLYDEATGRVAELLSSKVCSARAPTLTPTLTPTPTLALALALAPAPAPTPTPTLTLPPNPSPSPTLLLPGRAARRALHLAAAARARGPARLPPPLPRAGQGRDRPLHLLAGQRAAAAHLPLGPLRAVAAPLLRADARRPRALRARLRSRRVLRRVGPWARARAVRPAGCACRPRAARAPARGAAAARTRQGRLRRGAHGGARAGARRGEQQHGAPSEAARAARRCQRRNVLRLPAALAAARTVPASVPAATALAALAALAARTATAKAAALAALAALAVAAAAAAAAEPPRAIPSLRRAADVALGARLLPLPGRPARRHALRPRARATAPTGRGRRAAARGGGRGGGRRRRARAVARWLRPLPRGQLAMGGRRARRAAGRGHADRGGRGAVGVGRAGRWRMGRGLRAARRGQWPLE
jgi:hypothetical protein